jgi:hypothetical protein
MKLGLADSTHDPQLRRLVRSMAMPGAIRVAFARETDFFRSLDIEGPFNQVIIASEQEQLYGMAVRSVKTVYVNGAEQAIGYLHGLRISDEARRSTLLGRGYRFLHQLHQDGRTPVYLTSIIETALPLINRGLRWSGYQPLPDPGKALRSLMVSFIAIRNQYPFHFRALLDVIYRDYCRRNYHYFLVGCHETSPLVRAMSSFFTIRYTSRIYLVYWQDGQEFARQIDPDCHSAN